MRDNDSDDGLRPEHGLLFSVMPVGDGQVKLVLDQVRQNDEGIWDHEAFITHSVFPQTVFEEGLFTDAQLTEYGRGLMSTLAGYLSRA